MKKTISILLIILSINVKAQIIAGDSIRTNMQYSNLEEYIAFTFIDLDNDGTNDVLFYTEVTEEGHTGIYDRRYTLQGMQNNIDFVIQTSTTCDTVSNQSLINKNLNWANGNVQRTLAYRDGFTGNWYYPFGVLKDNFIGFRIVYPSDTAYGWILIKPYADLIKSFAIQKTATGIKQVANINEQVIVYPNPAQNSLRVTVNDEQIAEIKMYDVLGKELRCEILDMRGNAAPIDVSNLSNGVYFIQVKTESGTTVKKIIKE